MTDVSGISAQVSRQVTPQRTEQAPKVEAKERGPPERVEKSGDNQRGRNVDVVV